MNDPDRNLPSSNQVEDQAAGWVLRETRGLTASEQDEFLQWLATDKRHGAALARHRNNWARLDLLSQWRPEHSVQPNPDLLAPSRKPGRRVLRFPRIWLTAVPLAAAIAIGFFLARPSAPPPVPAAPITTSASIAAIEQRVLEDGSVVELNRGAEVEVNYTGTERRVQLNFGEANFKVAKNFLRPFIVVARGIEVHAVGTAFNVRLGGGEVEILVTEGKVRIEQTDTSASHRETTVVVPTLAQGEYTVVSTSPSRGYPQVYAVSTTQVDQMLAWRPRMLDFNEASLREIVAEFNRRNEPIHLVIGDLNLAETEMSATLRSDNVEGFIRLLEAGFGVHAQRSGNKIILHRR